MPSKITHKQIEFEFADSERKGWRTVLDKQRELYTKLLYIPGLLPYRQNFSDKTRKQFALTVVMLDNEDVLRNRALTEANKIGLEIESESKIAGSFVPEILTGTYPFVMKMKV